MYTYKGKLLHKQLRFQFAETSKEEEGEGATLSIYSLSKTSHDRHVTTYM